MDVAERSRLEKLLGMLGSSFDGERANAARMIAAMAERKKVTIPELIFGSSGSSQKNHDRPRPRQDPPKAKTRPQTKTILDALKDIAASADELGFVVTEWEIQFCADVSEKYDYDYELSEKQLSVAQRIIGKVEKARESEASA